MPQVMMNVLLGIQRTVESCFSGLRHKPCIFLVLAQVWPAVDVPFLGQNLPGKVSLPKKPRSMTQGIAALPAHWSRNSARM